MALLGALLSPPKSAVTDQPRIARTRSPSFFVSKCALKRMWELLARHATPDEIGGLARGRVTLDRSLQRLERELGGGLRIAETSQRNDHPAHSPMQERDMAQQHAIRTEASADARTAARADQPVGDLVKDAIAETQELIKLEVALAKKEATREIAALKISAILFGVAAVVGILGTAMLLVALVLAMNPAPLAALVVGAVLLLGGAVATFVAIKQLPTTILGRTRRRLGTNIKQLKEHVA